MQRAHNPSYALLPFFVLAFGLTACIEDELQLSVEAFSKQCGSDEDCIAVFEGNVCGDCTCPNRSINRSEGDDYDKARDKLTEQCSESLFMQVSCDCAMPKLACVQGQCTASSPY